jgi:hypothetical protein
MITGYYFEGEAVGEAAPPGAGLADAAGEAPGLAVGEGCVVAPPSRTTELGELNPGKEKSSARNIKMSAATTVAFSSGFCAPRGPNAVWLPEPPKAAATSPPLPDCRRMTRIRKMQVRMNMPVSI